MPIVNTELLDTRQAAKMLGVATITLEKWRRERKHLPFIRVSPSCVRYKRIDLDQWMELNTVHPDGYNGGNQAA